MTLEQLQAMSDAELNEISAIKVMGWTIHEAPHTKFYEDGFGDPTYGVSGWNPTSDMNHTMELQNALDDLYYVVYTVNLVEMTGHEEDINFGCVGDVLKLTPRQRTIAAIKARLDEVMADILAKEE